MRTATARWRLAQAVAAAGRLPQARDLLAAARADAVALGMPAVARAVDATTAALTG